MLPESLSLKPGLAGATVLDFWSLGERIRVCKDSSLVLSPLFFSLLPPLFLSPPLLSVTILFLKQDTMTNATYTRKHLVGSWLLTQGFM